MSALTAETLVALAAPLDPERVKRREGAGGKALDYLETHDVIRTANTIFGFGQWGHEIVELRELGMEPVKSRYDKEGFRVGYRCTLVLQVNGCVPVSGVGYGDAQEYNGSTITPHELAAKEAESDALKRAFKNFGDQFGLVLYAKGAPASAPAKAPAQGTFKAPTGPGAPTPATGAVVATEKQVKMLKALSAKLIGEKAITPEQLASATGGVALDELSKRQASDLIERLQTFEKNWLESKAAA